MNKDKALRLALEALSAYLNATDSEQDVKAHELMAKTFFALKETLEQSEPEPEGEQHMIYMTFNQWADGNFLETGEPRREAYSQAELDLVEMGWNYGYDAGVQWQKSQQALDKKADNARELGLDYESEPSKPPTA